MLEIIIFSISLLLIGLSAVLLPMYVARKSVQLVDKQLLERFEKDKAILPSGWYSANQLRGAQLQWKKLPWGMSKIVVQLRTLTAGEKPEVSVLNRLTALKEKPQDWESKARYLNTLEEYCRRCLVVPTYEEIEKEVLGCDGKAVELRNKLKELKAKVKEIPPGKEMLEYEREVREMELLAGYCMPINFMMSVSTWAECLDVTKIGETEDADILNAWFLSQEYHNRASDNVQGVFFEKHRKQFDLAAMSAGIDWKRKQDEKNHKAPRTIRRK